MQRELNALNVKLDKCQSVANGTEEVGKGIGTATGVVSGFTAGIAAEAKATVLSAGTNLLVAPAAVGLGVGSFVKKLGDSLGEGIGFVGKKIVEETGNMIWGDDQKQAKSEINKLATSINSAKSTLSKLNELEHAALRAKYASDISDDHKSAYKSAINSEYDDLTEKHQSLMGIVSKVPGLNLAGGTDAALKAIKQDLKSNDPHTKALALRRLYQAELVARDDLPESPAIYKQHILHPEVRVASATLRAMVEEPELRPGHYNQVLSLVCFPEIVPRVMRKSG